MWYIEEYEDYYWVGEIPTPMLSPIGERKMEASTTARLQAKAELRKAYYLAYPGLEITEARKQVDKLLADIEDGARQDLLEASGCGEVE